MSRVATKTATIYTRVDPRIKEESEKVLNKLGISMSNAVGMFLHQVVLKQGIPMDLTAQEIFPPELNVANISKEQFETMLEESLNDVANGKVYTLEDLHEELQTI